jgi:hypothetical protein
MFRYVTVAAMVLVLVGTANADMQQIEQAQRELQAARAQHEALKARMARVQGQSDETWLNARRAEEVKALVHEVLADADTRASLMAEGVYGGHNGERFWLGAADGTFLLEISGLIQVRHTYNDRDGGGGGPITGFDAGEQGFTIPRAKIQFAGHVGSPRIEYAVRLNVNRDDNSVWADRIVASYCLTDNLWIGGGEDKGFFLREELTEAQHQLAVDRSLVNELFTVGRVQGVWLKWHANDMVHVAASINDGIDSGEYKEDEASKDFDRDDTDFAVTARVDLKLMGQWKQYEDFTAWSGEDTAIFVGGAIHYEVRETGDTSGDPAASLVGHTYDTLLWTVDLSAECHGANLYAAIVGATYDAEGPVSPDPDPLGVIVQGGYQFLPDQLEGFIRYEFIDLDDATIVEDDLNLLTVGANYYFNRHRSKFTMDLVWAMDPLPSEASLSGVNGRSDRLAPLGLLPDVAGEEDQIALRTQFTLLF